MIFKFIENLGAKALYYLSDLGRMGVFLFRVLAGVFKRPFRYRAVLGQLREIGANSLGVIFFTAAFTGMVLGLQGYYTLRKFGSEGLLGSAVSLSLLREMGPVLTALMVTGRAGSAMCAEIGIMRNSEQIDALECMAVDPFRYLITPKFVAILIAVPLLTMIFNVVGICGGYLAGVKMLGVNPGAFFSGMESSVVNRDISMGIIKALVFAVLIVWICTGRGYYVDKIDGAGYGAEGVSRVTTQAVVLSSISILVWDYILTAMLL
ncbi:MAG: MlaE family lipid ABC transporter permease subunit [Desulfurivibrionaceae bacterium]|nr:MlaE family lipid ABC transporter permease subunit [Desulfobulbales bacterium]MDT8334538.1 MlaE family lipid ABC transporter permease subunit [Desulfurivibrionaceae bacterium]